MSEEIWKPIPQHPNYEISNVGNIRRVVGFYIKKYKDGSVRKTKHRGGLLSLRRSGRRSAQNTKTYYYVQCLDGKYVYNHRLVAEAFVPNPNNYPQVNHINGNKLDNRVENLEWVTPQMNVDHAVKNKLIRVGVRHQYAKLDPEKVSYLREWYKKPGRIRRPKAIELAKKFNCSTATIYSAAKGELYTCY
jgi:hypothetical protein